MTNEQTDWRALCAELTEQLDDALDFTVSSYTRDHMKALTARARAALAQPEPEGPTDLDAEFRSWYNDRYGRSYFGGIALVECIEWTRHIVSRYFCPTTEPVPVAERLPEPGKKVLAHYLNALGKPRTIIAEWVPAKTREDSPEGDLGEYDDETDLFYWPEGWYEQIENWADFTALLVDEGEITHWQPLPRGPHHALPIPTTH